MKIAILIKQVPETSSVKLDPETGVMVRDGVEAIINPLDLYAIETAIRLQESFGGKTTCITMGPPKAEIALREAIAMGVDSGILVTDKVFAGSDTLATATLLAKVIKSIDHYDIILCGERATDGDTGQTGPAVAAIMDMPVATYISNIEYISDGICRCNRLIETGHELIDVQLPAVLTIVKEIGTPRLPTLHGKRKSRTAQIQTITSDNLDNTKGIGLKESPTKVVKIFRPKIARECEMIDASDDDSMQIAIERTISFMQDRELI